MHAVAVGEAMSMTKNLDSAARLRLLSQIRQLAQMAIYGSLAALSTVHIYISATAEKPEKLPAIMSPTMQRLRSAREWRLGLNFKIGCENLPP